MTTQSGGGPRTAAPAAPHTYASRRPSLSRRLGTVLIAARLLGIDTDGRSLAWCPGCGVETGRRGVKLRRDGTRRVGVTPSGLGWRCYGCQAGGSAADLVSWHRFRRPVQELSRDDLRALGEHVDALTGDTPAAPPRSAPAAYMPPSAADREARAKEAEARRWARVCGDAADYVRDLLARTGARSEREAWDLQRFSPPAGAAETGAIRWRGEHITWPALQAIWRISVLELELRNAGDG